MKKNTRKVEVKVPEAKVIPEVKVVKEVELAPVVELTPVVEEVVEEPVVVPEVKEVKKVKEVDNRPQAVKFTGGTLIATNLTLEQAKQKLEALEAQDKNLKGKCWKPNFYEIVEC